MSPKADPNASIAPSELSSDAVIRLFRDCGALLEGHFLLSSGMHSAYYLQCARVLMEPARAMRVCAALLAKLGRELPGLSVDAVVAPALGGLVLGYELARQLAESVPQNLKVLGQDLERNFKTLLQSGIERMELVSREEFDVQRAVLERTRAKLEAMEGRLAELEKALASRK